MSETVQEIEGWYPDPWESAEQRWWDGREWTSLVRSPGRGHAERHDIPTGTVWIWLVVLLPLVWWAMAFVEPPTPYPGAAEDPSSLLLGFLFYGIALVLVPVLMIVFAAVDWQALRDRGIENPFHWGWSFLVVLLLIGSGVYVIGRAVVLRRQTGHGLGPVWGWIVVSVIGLVVTVVYVLALLYLVGVVGPDMVPPA